MVISFGVRVCTVVIRRRSQDIKFHTTGLSHQSLGFFTSLYGVE